MLATLLFLVFMFITHIMKLTGIRMLKHGKVSGIFIVMIMKFLFWISVLEIVYIWAPNILLFALPVVFIIFLVYIVMEKTMFYQAFKRKTKEAS
ncbi:hypothetical protein U8V72_18405 [Priestia filamentosa]|uniref:hypothetical protein n=1 Tax=Priestia filamentosa TaxID=1402861 RepID=UPI00058905CD